MYNITHAILDAAKDFELTPIGTGGGCDFITATTHGATNHPNPEDHTADFVLVSQSDFGSSPDTLDEPSTVAIHINDPEWANGVYVDFDSAERAMTFMVDQRGAWRE